MLGCDNAFKATPSASQLLTRPHFLKVPLSPSKTVTYWCTNRAASEPKFLLTLREKVFVYSFPYNWAKNHSHSDSTFHIISLIVQRYGAKYMLWQSGETVAVWVTEQSLLFRLFSEGLLLNYLYSWRKLLALLLRNEQRSTCRSSETQLYELEGDTRKHYTFPHIP